MPPISSSSSSFPQSLFAHRLILTPIDPCDIGSMLSSSEPEVPVFELLSVSVSSPHPCRPIDRSSS